MFNGLFLLYQDNSVGRLITSCAACFIKCGHEAALLWDCDRIGFGPVGVRMGSPSGILLKVVNTQCTNQFSRNLMPTAPWYRGSTGYIVRLIQDQPLPDDFSKG